MSPFLKFVSTWRVALPSVVVGVLAVVVAAYGTLLLPKKLPARYSAALEEKLARLASLKEGDNFGEIRDQAAELDVIYQRLVLMEGYANSRYWQWARFQSEHTGYLRTLLADSQANVPEDLRKELDEQAARFDEQAKATLKQLSVGESEFRDRASLRLASILYDEGMEEFGVANAMELVNELGGLVEDGDAQLSEVEKREAASLLNRVVLEAAWRNAYGVLAVEHLPAELEVEQKLKAGVSLLDQEDTELFRELFSAYGLDYPEIAEVPAVPKDSAIDAEAASESKTRVNWRTEFSKLQRLCLKGQWEELSLQLAKGGTDNDKALAAGTARTLCRLLCSSWADQQPEEAKLEIALELVARMGPHLPEFAEVIWACSVSQLDEGGDLLNAVTADHVTAPISKKSVSAISAGSSAMLKHSVFAISNALEDRENVAKSHLQLIKRGGGNLSFIARAILRHIQVLNVNQARKADVDALVHELTKDNRLVLERLEKLLQAVTLYEKESGLNWFTLASLELKLERLDEAKSAAEQAAKLLGEIPAVDQLLQTIKDAEKAVAQLN